MKKSSLAVVVLVVSGLAALALSACGGGGNNSSADQDQITKQIQFAATSGDPKACTTAQTQHFTDQTSGDNGTGTAAVRTCEQDASQGVADKVDVSDISVDGDNATAKVAITGSVFDGQTLNVALVKEGGTWKLDDFKGFEGFNRDAMIASLSAELGKQGLPSQGVDCIKTQLEKQSDQQLQQFFLNPSSTGAAAIFSPCQQFFAK